MTQVLCYTGVRFDTCWQPSNTATNHAIAGGLYTPVKWSPAPKDGDDPDHPEPYNPRR